MAMSMSRASSAAATWEASTDTLDKLACGDSVRSAEARRGKNRISPKSDKDKRQWRWLLRAANGWWFNTRLSMANSCDCMAGASCSHRRVGCKPTGERTNSSSPKKSRNRARALLVAGCDKASALPAAVTDRVRWIVTNTRNKFKSSCRKFMLRPWLKRIRVATYYSLDQCTSLEKSICSRLAPRLH